MHAFVVLAAKLYFKWDFERKMRVRWLGFEFKTISTKLDETTFPSDIVDLTKIPEIVRGKKKEMDSTHQNRSIKNVPGPEGIATFYLKITEFRWTRVWNFLWSES